MITRHYRSTVFIICVSLIAACSAKLPYSQTVADQTRQAEAMMRQEQFRQAASLYHSLAIKSPAQQNQYRLLAAEALVKSGDHDSAKRYVDSIDPDRLPVPMRSLLNLIQAQISLSHGNPDYALNRLNQIAIEYLNPDQQVSFYQSRAFAYSLTGQILASAAARVELHRLLNSPEQIKQNNTAIFETLSLLPIERLQENQPADSSGILGGWLALTQILKTPYFYRDQLNDEIALWQQNFPTHPANGEFLQQYLARPENTFKQPAAIAVMLPESGPYQQPAQIIKEGIKAAYFQQLNASEQPTMRFYDSALTHPVTLYNQAVSEGAELVLGPLTKENITELAAGSGLEVPVLALNSVDYLSKRNLFQFGLNPLDEAQQLTAKARQDGHSRALILTPEGEQGDRIAQYLSENWQLAGGIVLAAQTYNPHEHDYSPSIIRILNLDESDQRYQKIRNLLGRNLEFVPRRRHDVDAIFIDAYPSVARSLNPQLRFYHATQVPVYATPNLYTGVPNAAKDIDLDNIAFCDLPWLFGENSQEELSQETLRGNWQHYPASHLRLLALGMDAYDVIAHLDNLTSTPFHGATGNLLLNEENRITRQLVCAKFKDGIPVTTGFVDYTPEEPTEELYPNTLRPYDSEPDYFHVQ